MSMSDPIADMLTRIRNAQAVDMPDVSMPHSKMKLAIAKTLKEEGYIHDFHVGKQGSHATLTLILKYFENKPVIELIWRVSRPGLRIYRGVKGLPTVMGGLGIAIISTSNGVMSNRQAIAEHQGGEVLCIVE